MNWNKNQNKIEKALDDIFDLCQDPKHTPGPLLLVVRPGEYVDFKCPTCGHVTRIWGSRVTC